MSGSDEQRILLVNWLRNCRRAQDGHYAAAHLYSKINLFIGIPTIIISSIVGTSIFSTLNDSVDQNLKILAGVASVFSAVLGALQTFLSLPEKSERHSSAAVAYGALRREIQQMESQLKARMELKQEDISRIREKIDSLAKESPLIPRHVMNKLFSDIPRNPISNYYSDEKSIPLIENKENTAPTVKKQNSEF